MTTRVVKDAETLPAPGNREIVTREPESVELAMSSVQEVKNRFHKIQEVINDVLKDGVDYGIVPGTSRVVNGVEMAKPTLFKAGAEKIATLFLFDAAFDNTLTYDGDHLTVTSYCTLYHIPTGRRVGSGSAICSTRESKYAFRTSNLKCPSCGKEALIHTKRSPTDWWCSSYKGGCSANFTADDPKVAGQERGQMANDKLPDQYNTIIKMAEKRAKVGAIIGATGASEFVTQDLEDLVDNGVIEGGAGASDTKKAGTDASGDPKTSQKGSNASKRTSSKAQENGKGGAADRISADDVKEIELICMILETEADDILNYYKNSSEEAKKTVKTFADFTPGMLANLRMQAEKQAKKENKDLKTALAEAKAKSDEGAPA